MARSLLEMDYSYWSPYATVVNIPDDKPSPPAISYPKRKPKPDKPETNRKNKDNSTRIKSDNFG